MAQAKKTPARRPSKTGTKATVVATPPVDLPAYLQGPADIPQDNFDSNDIEIPQVRLLQGLSEAVQEYPEAEAGNFWHTGFDKSLASEFDFVVCARRKRYMLVAPMEDDQGILARADDGEQWDRTGDWTVRVDKKTQVVWKIEHNSVKASGLAEWGTYDPTDPSSPPAATLFYDYLVVLPDHLDLGPAVISLSRSQIKRARRGLNDKIALHQTQGKPLQCLRFGATVRTETNPHGQSYYNWQFVGRGFADEAVYEQAKSLSGLLQVAKVKDDGLVEPQPGDPGFVRATPAAVETDDGEY